MSMLPDKTWPQSYVSIEGYYYRSSAGQSTWVPKISYENNKKWYAEARYNYEDPGAFSLIAGKVFLNEKKLSYSITPMGGVAFGKFNGALLGLKAEMNYRNLFFSSESQYSFSLQDQNKNFFYSWPDVGYQIRSWIYAGAAMQLTVACNTTVKIESGVFVGFTIKKWTFPIYIFNPGNKNRNMVMGINYELVSFNKKSKNDSPKPKSIGPKNYFYE